MNLRIFSYIILFFIALLPSCIEDGYTSSPADQPRYSTDTLDLGVVYTEMRTTTARMTVHNPHSKGLNISQISISGEQAQAFRINVDGLGGDTFSDIEIRANDSIFVLVDAYLPANGEAQPQKVHASIDFMVNGVKSSVVLSATGQDIERMHGVVLEQDTRLQGIRPYQVYDSLVVAPGVTLTLDPGVTMLFHDKSRLIVHGTLIANGEAHQPIVLNGDRTGEVLPDVSFDIMSRQWDGVVFTPSSHDNFIAYTQISNTCYGVSLYGDGSDAKHPMLTAINSKFRNSGQCAFMAFNASTHAVGCEFAEAAHSLLYLVGGYHRIDLCTISNHYLFSAIESGSLHIADPAHYPEYADVPLASVLVTNSILWGLGLEIAAPADYAEHDIYFKRCLFKSAGEDDDKFVDCIWESDPLFYTVRDEYIFDYRLRPESPAIGAAYPELSEMPISDDFYGVERSNDLGAYAFVSQEN